MRFQLENARAIRIKANLFAFTYCVYCGGDDAQIRLQRTGTQSFSC